MKRRVALVSVGVLSPLGTNWAQFSERIFLERDWFQTLPERLGYPEAAAVDNDKLECFYKERSRSFKYRRYYNRATDMAVATAFECVQRMDSSWVNLEKLAIYWGAGPNFDLSAFPAELATYRALEGLKKDGQSPHQTAFAAWMLHYLPNMTASAISSAFGTHGEALTYVTACAASSHAIGEAFLKVRDGYADLALCGGSDSRLNPGGIMSYRMLGVLSSSAAPKVLPMCRDRDGFVPGEGAAAFLLTTADVAESMGVPILAEVVGYGASSDGFRLTDPDPAGYGMENAMAKAIKSAGMTPDEVDIINAHGTGTLLNDTAEASAIKRLFGRRIPVTSNKSQFGHLSAAAGALEFAACVAMIGQQHITPTVNTAGRDIEPGIDLVSECRRADIRAVLSNSFGFGGQNSTLILKKWKS
jgi:3-oxoacyl-[acyl-carrier-protein] synthase II